MRQWLVIASEHTILVIDALALAVIAVGTVDVVVRGAMALVSPSTPTQWRRGWVRYGRWLVVALTFQLASDIVETSITTSWAALGRLAAIAVIRTVLNYFLERDLAEVREQLAARPPPSQHAEVAPSAMTAG